MLWTDNGGIEAPTKYTYSYIPMNSDTNEWVTAGTITSGIMALTTPIGSSNVYEFDSALEVKSLRVTMTKRARNGNGVGLWEWEVFQPKPKQDQAAPDTSEWTITNANSNTNGKGKIVGVNDTMEYRKLGDENYTPVIGTSIDNLEPGSYQIRYVATDELNASEPVTVEIGVVHPLSLVLDKTELWPANNKMVQIHATLNYGGNPNDISEISLTSITSNEPAADDISVVEFGKDVYNFNLRASRLGNGTGRVYTIVYTVTFTSSEVATVEGTVTVPHDRGQ